MNYCTLEQIKSELDISADGSDDILTGLLPQAKTLIDNHCDRQFDTSAATRYFDGGESPLFIDDLVTMTSVALDEDGDGTFEATMATSDYILYPLNKTPKTRLAISNNGNYGDFADGILQGVKISGIWGYQLAVPEDIKRAAIIQVCRWFKRRESAFQDVVSNVETGQVTVYKGLDPDVALILKPYIKRGYP